MDTITITKPKTTPRDFFLYVGVMVLLYGSVFALIQLLFSYINYTFPDQLNDYYDPFSGTMRLAMAYLIILFPAFLVGTWFINKDIRMHAEKESLGIRKWLTFLALFIAGAGLLIDLSLLVYGFLGGEVTTRFLLKVLSIIVIAGFALSYYTLDLRGKISANKKLTQLFGGLSLVLVFGTIILSFFVVGTPGAQRDLRFDYERINALQSIQFQVVNYWMQNGKMPQTLSQLTDSISGYAAPVDPVTGAEYTYRVIKDLQFELCATFARESSREPFDPYNDMRTAVVGAGMEGSWKHPAGEHCFERTIDPKKYPVNSDVKGIPIPAKPLM